MNTSGIYKITNNITGEAYVGQSINIEYRWRAHQYSSTHKTDDSHTKLHKNMAIYGIENFNYEIIEECNYYDLDKKETYWINYYDTYNNGLNMTSGGSQTIGEKNPNHKLLETDVIEIRLAYGNHIPFREVYNKYKNKISKRGLQKVWQYETWLTVLPEVYTDENLLWHKTSAKSFAQQNAESNDKRQLSLEEVYKIRQLRNEGYTYEQISSITNRSTSSIKKYCLFDYVPAQSWSGAISKGHSKKVKNIETGLVFDSMAEAGKWAQVSYKLISKNKDTSKAAGIVQSTGLPAHWISQ